MTLSMSGRLPSAEAADGRIPGVISGKCKGEFERFESDIPPPAMSARTRATGAKVGWLR